MCKRGTMDNKRRYSRKDVQGMEADISDDIGFCSARVRDVSRFGICLSEMPRKLRVKGDTFLLVVSIQGHRFKMYAQHRWVSDQGLDRLLGVEIKNPTLNWTEFVSTMETDKDDVWGSLGRLSA